MRHMTSRAGQYPLSNMLCKGKDALQDHVWEKAKTNLSQSTTNCTNRNVLVTPNVRDVVHTTEMNRQGNVMANCITPSDSKVKQLEQRQITTVHTVSTNIAARIIDGNDEKLDELLEIGAELFFGSLVNSGGVLGC